MVDFLPQERGGNNSFTHEALTLKYKLDNQFELVFVVSGPRHAAALCCDVFCWLRDLREGACSGLEEKGDAQERFGARSGAPGGLQCRLVPSCGAEACSCLPQTS